ncbi:MAG: STAS domain-containing protein [Planctomycetota bacterium]|jgi:anti-anti-sigma factor
MAIERWSDDITLLHLTDHPQLADDLNALLEQLETQPSDCVLNFAAVSFINSSDVAKLLRLRKMTTAASRRLLLCDVNRHVWGIFQVTGLDKIFEFTNDVATALASVQIGNGEGAEMADEES